jgi:hypothetical protein
MADIGKEKETPWNDEAVYDAALRGMVNVGWGYDLKVATFDPRDPELAVKLNALIGSAGEVGDEVPLKIFAARDITQAAYIVWYYEETPGGDEDEDGEEAEA